MRIRFERWILGKIKQPTRPLELCRWLEHLTATVIAASWMFLWINIYPGQISLAELFVLTVFAGTPTYLIVCGCLERLRRYLIWRIEDGALK